jgi:hypothetical protein
VGRFFQGVWLQTCSIFLSKTLDLQFGIIPIDFGGHLQGGRNISLLQPERGTTILDLKVIAHQRKKLIL